MTETRDHGAWQVNDDLYLTLHATEKGWAYSIYNNSYQETDSGRVDLKSLSLVNCRDAILFERDWAGPGKLMELDYEEVEAKAEQAAREKLDRALRERHERKRRKLSSHDER